MWQYVWIRIIHISYIISSNHIIIIIIIFIFYHTLFIIYHHISYGILFYSTSYMRFEINWKMIHINEFESLTGELVIDTKMQLQSSYGFSRKSWDVNFRRFKSRANPGLTQHVPTESHLLMNSAFTPGSASGSDTTARHHGNCSQYNLWRRCTRADSDKSVWRTNRTWSGRMAHQDV